MRYLGRDGAWLDAGWHGPVVSPIPVCDVDLGDEAARVVSANGAPAAPDIVWLLIRQTGEPLFAGPVEYGRPLEKRDLLEVSRSLLGTPKVDLPREVNYVPFSVVVCTRARPESLARCLASVERLSYAGPVEVVVVDNDSVDSARSTVAALKNRAAFPVHYVHEPRAGLSNARNRGVQAARHDHVAFLDDDEEADTRWLTQMANAFARDGRVGVVTGYIAPADLSSEASIKLEEFGGFSKGRHLQRILLHAGNCEPLLPMPAFGAGGNMAFTKAALRAAGGFDAALGAGTPTPGGEDTLFFTKHLLNDGTLAYEPGAIVWHHHRHDLRGLEKQMNGYGQGLTAVYTSLLLTDPKQIIPLLRLFPRALRSMLVRDRSTDAGGVPANLLTHNWRSMLRGPMSYRKGRLDVRRAEQNARRSATLS